MRVAIITGASSGLGYEYARLTDAQNVRAVQKGRQVPYDEIWLIARRGDRLKELARQCQTTTRIFALDLSQWDSIEAIENELKIYSNNNTVFDVGLIVNAAGFGKFGTYSDMTADEEKQMIDLNCRALVGMTQVCLPYMKRRDRIIEIASSAAFQPLPGLNVYAASKAFVLSYTRGLRFELRGTGIHATAVCPIWIKTEFVKVARQTANGQTVRHPFPQLSPRHVVRWSTLVSRANYPVATCCISALAMRIACKVVPASIIMWIWEGLRRI